VEVPSLTWEEAGSLEVPFLEVEVKEIIDASHNNKSPGPNGFNFEFFSECWEVVKMDLMQLFQEFYFNARVPKGMLSYLIALIPKISNAHAIPNFRPISLLGSVYKVVAKVLASRLRVVMGKLISRNQSAFIKGRLLVDGVLTINEVVDYAKRAKKKCLILKVDFEKAYDSVNWKFLEYMLRRFGFTKNGLNGSRHACVLVVYPC
jgi:hypothetical protein